MRLTEYRIAQYNNSFKKIYWRLSVQEASTRHQYVLLHKDYIKRFRLLSRTKAYRYTL